MVQAYSVTSLDYTIRSLTKNLFQGCLGSKLPLQYHNIVWQNLKEKSLHNRHKNFTHSNVPCPYILHNIFQAYSVTSLGYTIHSFTKKNFQGCFGSKLPLQCHNIIWQNLKEMSLQNHHKNFTHSNVPCS